MKNIMVFIKENFTGYAILLILISAAILLFFDKVKLKQSGLDKEAGFSYGAGIVYIAVVVFVVVLGLLTSS